METRFVQMEPDLAFLTCIGWCQVISLRIVHSYLHFELQSSLVSMVRVKLKRIIIFIFVFRDVHQWLISVILILFCHKVVNIHQAVSRMVVAAVILKRKKGVATAFVVEFKALGFMEVISDTKLRLSAKISTKETCIA